MSCLVLSFQDFISINMHITAIVNITAIVMPLASHGHCVVHLGTRKEIHRPTKLSSSRYIMFS